MPIRVVVDSHSEADQVLRYSEQLVKKYDYLSVADLYEIVGEFPTYSDSKVGWTDISTVKIGRTGDGLYSTLTFPDPIILDF